MLRLLRNIRRSLIKSGATRKYLMYAGGEIILVVLGILIALQINNWNVNRLNSIEEERILQSIFQKNRFNRFQHDTGSERYKQVIIAAERMLLCSLNDGPILEDEEMATNLHLITKRFLMGANNATHLYDELIGSGQLGLISSHELRDVISALKINLELLSAYEDLQTGFVDNQLIPYLNRHIDRLSVSAIGARSDSSRYDALLNLDPKAKIDKDYPKSFQYVLSDQEFANLLVELVKQTKRLLPIYTRIDADLSQIDSLLNLRNLE